jgi:hypothetical protein
LRLAAYENESLVDAALGALIAEDHVLTVAAVERVVQQGLSPTAAPAVQITSVELSAYDALLAGEVA